MKSKRNGIKLLSLLLMTVLLAGSLDVGQVLAAKKKTKTETKKEETVQGQIYLYGESHGDKNILEKEYELWSDYYNNQGMRHLFIELPYYFGEYLNQWMKAKDDKILDQLFKDIKGTQMCTKYNKKFYQKIKKECPDTIFHGTDVGHFAQVTGKRYLKYLKKHKLTGSDQEKITKENMEQGKQWDETKDNAVRDTAMAENFSREFDQLKGESIMGIYGSQHTYTNAMDASNTVPCMAAQLYEKYGDIIQSTDLSLLKLDIDPIRTDKVNINGKDYEASYFGEQSMKGLADYISREIWRVENAYNDFKDCKFDNDYLPVSNYPMLVKKGQVFIIKYTRTSGTDTYYYRADGNEWNEQPVTERFVIE